MKAVSNETFGCKEIGKMFSPYVTDPVLVHCFQIQDVEFFSHPE